MNDGEWTYTWQNGRQLASMTNGTTTASFVYNENGLRVQKTVNGVVTDYTLHGKNIVHMTCGSDNLHFFYDAKGKPAVVVYNGTPYSYVKNLQGDIIAILDSAGVVVVAYTYDAWGKPIATTGSMADTLGEVNPFRYRGYVFDETACYYLSTRYYSAAWGRFLNADAIHNLSSTLLGCNIFAYCNNNPVVFSDSDGTLPRWLEGVLVIAGTAVAAIAVTAVNPLFGPILASGIVAAGADVLGQTLANGFSQVDAKQAVVTGISGIMCYMVPGPKDLGIWSSVIRAGLTTVTSLVYDWWLDDDTENNPGTVWEYIGSALMEFFTNWVVEGIVDLFSWVVGDWIGRKLAEKPREFLQKAALSGKSYTRVMAKHILRNQRMVFGVLDELMDYMTDSISFWFSTFGTYFEIEGE